MPQAAPLTHHQRTEADRLAWEAEIAGAQAELDAGLYVDVAQAAWAS